MPETLPAADPPELPASSVPASATLSERVEGAGVSAGQVEIEAAREYVSGGSLLALHGGGNDAYTNYARALPLPFDDVGRDFGWDLYDRMARDPQLAGDTLAWKAMVLANGVRLVPSHPDEKDAEHPMSAAIRDWCQTNLDEMETPLLPLLEDMLSAFYLGSRVAEIVYREEVTGGQRRLMLHRLKVKPRENVAFIVDAAGNHIGYLGALVGEGFPFLGGTMVLDPAATRNYLPLRKFALMTFRPVNGDPRGTSAFRPCYGPWWEKQQTIGELLKFIAQFAGAGLVAILKEGARAERVPGADGKPVIVDPAQQVLAAVEAFRNGAAVVLPGGTTVQQMVAEGAHVPFFEQISRCDRDMSKALLGQTLTTNEGKHESRSAAKTAKSVTDLLVQGGEEGLSAMLRTVLRTLLEINFGPDAARRYCPAVSLSAPEETDFAPIATATATLFTSGFLAPNQRVALAQRLGLPAPEDEPEEPEDGDGDDSDQDEGEDDTDKDTDPKKAAGRRGGRVAPAARRPGSPAR